MEIDIATTPVQDIYHVLVGAVTPRPIAWVTTIDQQGRVNLAPFSFFNTFGANPPVVVFSPTRRRDGSKKDTLNNLEQLGEFVIHSATKSLAEQVNLSSKEIPADQSEIDLTGLPVQPSKLVKPPRLVDALIAMEGKVRQIIPVGDGPISANLVIGEIVYIHVAESVLDEQRRIDPRKLQTIARLGGEYYCHTSDLFILKRPT